jgi:hypothetical protein
MKTSEVLYKAADLIEERGWTEGVGWRHEDGGPLCLEGGILAAIGGSFDKGDHYGCPAYEAVRAYLGGPPFMWNDDLANRRVSAAIAAGECRMENLTEVRAEAKEWAKNEVIATLRAAAVIEAAKENSDTRTSVTA